MSNPKTDALMRLLPRLLKLKALEGYRSYIAVAALVGLAVYLAVNGKFEEALTNIALALGVLGIHDKEEPAIPPGVSVVTVPNPPNPPTPAQPPAVVVIAPEPAPDGETRLGE